MRLPVVNELTLQAPTPQNGQTHLSVFDHFVGLALKGLNKIATKL